MASRLPTLHEKQAKSGAISSCLAFLLACQAVPLAVGLLADVDYGRRLLQQVERLRQQERANQTELSALPPEVLFVGKTRC